MSVSAHTEKTPILTLGLSANTEGWKLSLYKSARSAHEGSIKYANDIGRPKCAAYSAPCLDETNNQTSGISPNPGVTFTDSKDCVEDALPSKKDFKSFILVAKNSGPVVFEP